MKEIKDMSKKVYRKKIRFVIWDIKDNKGEKTSHTIKVQKRGERKTEEKQSEERIPKNFLEMIKSMPQACFRMHHISSVGRLTEIFAFSCFSKTAKH